MRELQQVHWRGNSRTTLKKEMVLLVVATAYCSLSLSFLTDLPLDLLESLSLLVA